MKDSFKGFANNDNTTSAFIALVGRPNVGKSSILNRMVGEKIAIVSDKPQTTRTRITGIVTKGDLQLVFIDTPGLHKPHNALGENMVRAVSDGMADVDCCVLVVEADEKIAPAELDLIDRFKKRNIPAVLAINKIDLLTDKDRLLKIITDYTNLYNFSAIVPLSAKHNDNVDVLLSELEKFAKPSPHFFDDEAFTDQPERVLAGEIIREKLLRLLNKEVPHGLAIDIEKFYERENGILDLNASIYCERESHKGIIIGKRGDMLKKISSMARTDCERFMGTKVFLTTWVKVKENWRDSDFMVRNFGYRE